MKSGNRKKRFNRDDEHTAMLIRIGKTAAKEAIRSSKALGLSVTYLKKGEVVEELADGTIKVLKPKSVNQTPRPKLKKGMILHVKK
ncbi:MAG: hypothetical protein QE487_00320 [Fluviicola sp.]|nr:hypothetical protein [Fluviicola sp.]